MTIEEAKQEIPDIDFFCKCACNSCSSDGYCPTECDLLIKARKMLFQKIIACYARHEGDMQKVFKYIKRTKEV